MRTTRPEPDRLLWTIGGHCTGSDAATFQRTDSGEVIEIAIAVKNNCFVTNGAGGDEAVDRGADREALATSVPKDCDRFVDQCGRHRVFDDWKGIQRLARHLERVVVIEALQNFMNDRKTSHNLTNINEILDAEWRPYAQRRDPDARINEDHGLSDSSTLSADESSTRR